MPEDWRPSLGSTTRVAIAVGLLAGVVEIAILGFRRFALGQLNFIPQYYWWLAPVVTTLIVAVLSVAAGLLTARWTRARTVALFAVPVTLLIVTVAVRLFGDRLHYVAVWILATGVGIQSGRWLASRAARVARWATVATPLLAMVPLVCGATLLVERLRPRAPSGSPPTNAPNILLLILDTVRAADLGIYGGSAPETSSALAALAAEGAVFEKAYSSTSWSAPGHASVFTGLWAHQLSIDWDRRLKGNQPILAEVLAERGYLTAGFTANTEYVSRETGLARGMAYYEDDRLRLRGLLQVGTLGSHLTSLIGDRVPALRPNPLDDRIWAPSITEHFLTWLDRQPKGRPFYAFLNLFDAHSPYYPSDSVWRKFVGEDRRRPLDLLPTNWKPKAVDLRHRAYVGAIAEQDAVIGRLLVSLRERGLLEHTIVVVTSDHGEEFLEHGVMGHGQSLYLPSLQVPLVFRVPAGLMPAGRRVAEPVSTRQVAATLAELVGLDRPPFPGPSLVPAWRDTVSSGETLPIYFRISTAANLPIHYPVSHGPLRSILFRGHHLIVDGNGKQLLFDLNADPGELVDVSTQPASAGMLAMLRDSLERTIPR